jgi:hypothetical protein
MVSARTRLVRSSRDSAALASNASFSPSTAVVPHRVVSFIKVVGCDTRLQRNTAETPPRDRVTDLAA